MKCQKEYPLTDEFLLEKRLAIAHAAAELIFRKDIMRLLMTQIARKMGIGKSTIYDYFSSKDEIILLLLDEPLGEVRSRAEEIETEPGTAAER